VRKQTRGRRLAGIGGWMLNCSGNSVKRSEKRRQRSTAEYARARARALLTKSMICSRPLRRTCDSHERNNLFALPIANCGGLHRRGELFALARAVRINFAFRSHARAAKFVTPEASRRETPFPGTNTVFLPRLAALKHEANRLL